MKNIVQYKIWIFGVHSLFNLVFPILVLSSILYFFRDAASEAAVTPNEQEGACGPYYIWSQMSADMYQYGKEYVDLCGITFDIRDVVDDFDFVHFSDTATFQRSSLDRDLDGVSDLFFAGRTESRLQWKPEGGCIRINLKECTGTHFNEQCGYAMISIQPKEGYRSGNASIPIHITASCPPHGDDCSKSYVILHRFSECQAPALPDFSIQKYTNHVNIEQYNNPVQFTLKIQSLKPPPNETILSETIIKETGNGELILREFRISCPSEESFCKILELENDHFRMILQDIPESEFITVSYFMEADNSKVETGTISYFTSTSMLSNGATSKVTVGVHGVGKKLDSAPPPGQRRKEHPIQGTGAHRK